MIRANVYSAEPLKSATEQAVNEGLELLGSYMGQKIVPKNVKVRLPLTEAGRVTPRRVGLKRLDKLVELHLFAVPLEKSASQRVPNSERVGFAHIGAGVAFIDTGQNSSELIRATTSHETAHAFGFVRPDARQRDIHDPYHCCSPSCLLHKVSGHMTPAFQESAAEILRLAERFIGRQGVDYVAENIIPGGRGQDDFCKPCQVDLGTYSEEHLAQLRTKRILEGQVG